MERMIWQEIKARFPNEWVLLAQPETENGVRIKAGVPLAHSADRGVIYREQRNLHGDFAILFTGEIAKEKVFAL